MGELIFDPVLILIAPFCQDEEKEEPKHNGDASTSGEKPSASSRLLLNIFNLRLQMSDTLNMTSLVNICLF